VYLISFSLVKKKKNEKNINGRVQQVSKIYLEGHYTVSHMRSSETCIFLKSTVRMERRRTRVNYQLEFSFFPNRFCNFTTMVIYFLKIGMVELKHCFAFFHRCELTVAHNCHGKTKSHGTTNLTHGKTGLSDSKTKLIHGSTQLIHGKTKLTHGRTPLNHGKTKKTSWSAVGQRLLFAFQMVCRVTVTH